MPATIRKFQYYGLDTLQLPNEREAFTTLKTWLSNISEELGLPEKTKKQLLIVADEIFTNIVTYGSLRQDGTVEVKVEFDFALQTLNMTFIDQGIAYNPLEATSPDISKPLSERQTGGLGIFMVKKIMDSVEYLRENDQNYLILKKRLNNGDVQ